MENMRKMVRCKVCGAVFEEGAATCPVCGVGPENFEPVGDVVAYRDNTEDMYLILGGGVAAVGAAEAIRARDRTGSVVLLTEEAFLPYNRPMLTKKLQEGGVPDLINAADWYEENNIQIYTGMRAASIDPENREVSLENGNAFHYDKLIYALGAESFVPPIPGADLPHCVSVRRIEDVQRVETLLPEAKTAAVVGGGVLGLEAAWALRQRGLAVTVLEAGSRLMPRQLDEAASQLLLEAAGASGVEIVLNAQTQQVEPGRVALASGREIPADLVLFSCGVRANVEVARTAGIEIGRAVKVDAGMRTSLPGIYACGDCAEWNGTNLALWAEAEEQGRVAGANASGEDETFQPKAYPVLFRGFGTMLFSCGRITEDRAQDREATFFFEEDKLVGAIVVGNFRRMKAVMDWVARGVARKEVMP